MPRRFFQILLVFLLTTGAARADIYRREGDDGTLTFTDNPHNDSYSLVMREKQPKRQQKPSKIPPYSALPRGGPAGDSPVDGRYSGQLPLQGIITSSTGLRNDPFDGKLRHHNGLDIAAPTGTPVKAVAAGTVVFSGWRTGYGNTVIIDHNDGMFTVYAHHDSNQVHEGESVDQSTVIALSGSTGRSTGPHLHFEAWRNGENITRSFAPDSPKGSVQTVASAQVRRILQDDGTILFTNIQ